MEERKIIVGGDEVYALYRLSDRSKPTVVFVHGLGDSHLCFVDAFDYLPECNLVMFDLCGFGYSSAVPSDQYDTKRQAMRSLDAIAQLGVEACVLVGHSWGGDVGSLMCSMDDGRTIRQFINVEGGVHVENILLSKIITKKYQDYNASEFSGWVRGAGFAEQFSFRWGHSAGVKYLSSVRRCSPIALGEAAQEIYSQHQTQDSRGVVEWGRIYEKLSIPTVYLWGEKSLAGCQRAQEFIRGLDNISFPGANHWLQNDPHAFYKLLRTLISADQMSL